MHYAGGCVHFRVKSDKLRCPRMIIRGRIGMAGDREGLWSRCCRQLLFAVAPICWATALRHVKICHRHVFIRVRLVAPFRFSVHLRKREIGARSISFCRLRRHFPQRGNHLAAGKNVPPARFYPARPYGEGVGGYNKSHPIRVRFFACL